MALRYSSKNASVTQAGTDFTHGLRKRGANKFGPAATTPDEWSFNFRGAPGSATALYLVAADSTKITVAAVGATCNADVFCAVNASVVK